MDQLEEKSSDEKETITESPKPQINPELKESYSPVSKPFEEQEVHDLPIPNSPIPTSSSEQQPPPRPSSPNNNLVSTLKQEVSDLNAQLHNLNSKLVSSFHRISDLEDEKERVIELRRRVEELEKEKAEWERALEGGSLVERVSR
jgi:hypothetical protein